MTAELDAIPENDWPRCMRCGKYEATHWPADHRFRWPPLTKRELAVLRKVFPA